MGQVTISKDGRVVVLPKDTMTGAELKHFTNVAPERIPTVVRDGQTKAVGDHETIRLADGVFVSDVPDHQAGYQQSVGERLDREAEFVTQMYRQQAQVGYDADIGRWYLYLPEFRLPTGWRQDSSPIIVTVTDYYPTVMPDGFYLSDGLRDINGRTPGHYFETRSAHNPLTHKGWAWFCVHPTGWKSTIDIRDGDSLAKYLTLIHYFMSKQVNISLGRH